MVYETKEYQIKAIEDLIKSIIDLLSRDDYGKTCVFQSPTGSGKTIMLAKVIEGLIKDLPETDICFLWVSIGKGNLHYQSKKSLEKIFDGFPKCVLLENEFFGSRSQIAQNEVVIVNWEKLYSKYQSGDHKGDWKNKVMREGEEINFIEVLQKTKEKRKIILIIDESHYASDTKATKELREIINADVTVEMSATPKLLGSQISILRTMESPVKFNNGSSYYVYVKPEDVIQAGMIKKELIINEGIDKLVDDEKTSQNVILEAAFLKKIELMEEFSKIGSKINPLCIIQLPNAEAGEAKRDVIEAFLKDKGISESNNKLAIWLSDEKSENLDEISNFESPIEFLLFKQAVDTGWDCPRAHILIKLRDIQSYTFEVQTVGRILRMPELKHYDNELLNVGYIYTNLHTITVAKEEFNPNIIKNLKSIRKEIYKPICLQSYFKSRVDFGDITLSFQNVLEEVFCNAFKIEVNPSFVNVAENAQKLKDQGLTTDITVYRDSVIFDKRIEGTEFDKILGVINDEDDRTTLLRLADNDIQDLFNTVIIENLNGFAPKRSVPTVRGSIYQWFKKYLGINYQLENGIIHIQYLFLHNRNIGKFSTLLSKATGKYKPIKTEEVKKKIIEQNYIWEISKIEYFNQFLHEKVKSKLCIYEPCFLLIDRLSPEKSFEKFLDTQESKVEWWYKNGTNKKDYLGIRYEENGLPQTFYPDYIIQLKSSKVLIGDTKAGITAVEAKSRADALQVYIKTQNHQGKNLIGGIIIKDSTDKWRINQQDSYNYDKNDLTNWNYLEDII